MRKQYELTAVALLLSCLAHLHVSAGKCPHAHVNLETGPIGIASHESCTLAQAPSSYDRAQVDSLDIDAVKADIKHVLTDSKAFWPADFPGVEAHAPEGHYGGLMVRQAWHCSGSYRSWDGRGGCDGARQRFFPEGAWPDNTNLDKARKLLQPIKEKWDVKAPGALSFSDLIVLAGDTAIQAMGGPVLGFCAGRIDDADGSASLELGPTREQQAVAPCTRGQGMCEQPLGQTTMGLIYVDPEGELAVPEPKNTVAGIRSTFARMGMDDKETVALIGGGHAFGKTHGACPTGAGNDPSESPSNPWPGTCGSGSLKGKGPNAFTSGFEGPWTSKPLKWDNEYFKNLVEYDWMLIRGSGGHFQWQPLAKPGATKQPKDVMMLTSDMALLEDPEYVKYVKLFAEDQAELDETFKNAWYKLVTRDMGPYSRCLGKALPPPQPFQRPLPPPPSQLPDFDAVKADVTSLLKADAENGAKFTHLAWQCANTFRATDYAGGCNGARIRFSPQKDWPSNKGLDQVLDLLEPIKAKYDTLSYADLIVLAGTTALEQGASPPLSIPFCGGRTDASNGEGTEELGPRSYMNVSVAISDNTKVMGLTPRERVALAGILRSPSLQRAAGYTDSWNAGGSPSKLTHDYFKVLMDNAWEPTKSAAGVDEYRAVASKPQRFMTPSDEGIRTTPEFAAAAREFAANELRFLQALAAAWVRIMNADRFDGPAGNVCDKPSPS